MKIYGTKPPIVLGVNNFNNRNIISRGTEPSEQKPQWEGISNCFYYPLGFSGKKRTYSTDRKDLAAKPSQFKICRRNDIPCPACGKLIITKGKFSRISQELAKLDPDEYLDYLKKYKQHMRPVEESVFDEIYAKSQEPGASKDIRTLLVSLRDEKLPILQDVQLRLVNKMFAVARTLPDDEKEILLKKIEKLKNIIKKTSHDSPFRRKIMIDRISRLNIRNKNSYDKLQAIAHSFPTSLDMNSSWIVKYSGLNKNREPWSSYDIALRFLSSSVSNTDHIIAYSLEKNHDDISNYIAMHNGCNSDKSDKTFIRWLNEDKENRLEYLQNYFDKVNEMVQNKELKKGYKKYVAAATETIENITNGQIVITPNQPEKDAPKDSNSHELAVVPEKYYLANT